MSDEIRMFLGLLTGLLVSLLAIPPIIKVSRIKKLVAVPNGRTCHKGLVPSLGGVAIYAAVVMGTSLFIDHDGFGEFRFILASILIIFYLGLKDDLVNMTAVKKLLAELVAAGLVVIVADVRIGTLHGMFGVNSVSYGFSVSISIFVIIALINGFNLLDGIDGLASGMGIVISMVFGVWLFQLGYMPFALMAFSLAGGLFTFYLFNVFGRENKLFLGDTGSLLLGFLIAVLAIKVLCCEELPGDPLFMKSLPTVVMGVMIIPIVDTLRVFSMRIIRGKSPFSADKTHLHHYFLELGFSHVLASTTIIVMNSLLFGLAMAMREWQPVASAAVLFTTAYVLCLIPIYLARGQQRKAILPSASQIPVQNFSHDRNPTV
jgi:UDP-GlcNAc:undecaprenyl-phosphate/decaprenyl-phosphate GlcNAc-1-phosphate transferase